MAKKSKVIWFYLIIASFSFVVIFGMRYLGQLSRDNSHQRYYKVSVEEREAKLKAEKEMFSQFGIKDELKARLQDGVEVNLKEELAGKVVVFAQYFAECPQCMGTNFELLQNLLDEYDQEDLRVVTVNVRDVDFDQDLMNLFSEAWGKGDGRWLFAHTDVQKFNEWAQQNLGYAKFYDAEGEEALMMPVKHDMGISVIGRDQVMVNKEDIFSAENISAEGITAEQRTAHGQEIRKQLFESVRKTLTGIEEEVIEKPKTHIYLAISAGLLVAFISAYFVQSKLNPNKR